MLYLVYTREDALFAVRLTEELVAMGIDIWIDINELAPGTDWFTGQRAAIEACEGVIVIMSPEATKREHMQREIEQAFARQKRVYLAVARRSPWREWFGKLPIADFTSDYDQGLSDLLLHITRTDGTTNADALDEADRWLQAQQDDNSQESEEKRGVFSRLRRKR